MHPLTLLYTKLSSLSNDRSVYLNFFDHMRFFAGKYEDFCLRKIERNVNVLVVIILNIHKKAFVMNRFYLYV